MQARLLTGAFTPERAASLPQNDWRRRNGDFKGEALTRNLQFADALKPIAKRHDVSTAAVAVAWVLAWRGVSGAIVGARRPDQIDGWVGAGSLDLMCEDLTEIAAAIEKTGAGSGPALPPAT